MAYQSSPVAAGDAALTGLATLAGAKRDQLNRPPVFPLPRAVQMFWILLITTGLLTLIVAALGCRAHAPVTRWDPFSDPFLGDLMEYPGTYQMLHSAAFFSDAVPGALPRQMFSAVAYPPFAAVLLSPLYLVANPFWGFFSAAAAWLMTSLWKTRTLLRRNGFSAVAAIAFPFCLLAVSFPVGRLVHQGNLELLVWIFAGTGAWFFLGEKYLLAAVLWGLAGALKLYPAVLLLLLLPRRKAGALLAGVVTGVGVTWWSLWWLGPTVASAWNGSLQNVIGYQDLRASEWSLRELAANHSWFTWAKLLAQLLHVSSKAMLLPYVLGGGILLAVVLKRVWVMPVANQLLAFVVLMLGIPPVSYFHTLVHLYLPLLLLICVAVQMQRNAMPLRGIQRTLLLFLPLLAPYTLFLQPRALLFSGLLQSLTLLMLLGCALEFPFPGQVEFALNTFPNMPIRLWKEV